jgi:SAM-dependent methyltransferase
MKNTIKALIPTKLRSPIKRTINRVRYAGSNVHCPICDASFSRFVPYGLHFPVLEELSVVGGGLREYACCPGCGSTDRERLVWMYLLHELNINHKQWRILHVAPEKSLFNKLSKINSLDILTADISGRNVMVKMDITNIDIDTSQFDLIICNHVLEHIIDDRKAMAELYRVLKPGGVAILQVPMSTKLKETFEDESVTSELDRERVFGQKDHVRIYAPDYTERLASVGFKVELFKWWTAGADYSGSDNSYGLLNDETLFAVRK